MENETESQDIQFQKLIEVFEEASANDSNLIMLSLIIATTAVIGTILTSIYLRKQSQHLEKEIVSRIRPIIVRSNTPGTATINLTESKISCDFVNSGTMPALNVQFNRYSEIKKENTELKKFEGNSAKKEQVASLGPNESFSLIFDIDKERFIAAQNSDKLHYGLKLTYEDSDKNQYFYLMELHFDKGFSKFDFVDMN